MKHLDAAEATPTADMVASALRDTDVSATDAQCDLLARHAGMVQLANRRFNLTRIAGSADMVRLHVVDSLLPWSSIRPDYPVFDLGAGAGYPGIPMASVLGGPVLLCESVKKKAVFLADCVSELGIDVEVFADRAEQLARVRPESAGTVVARALASLPALVELAAPLLRPGGRLMALKGSPQEDEILGGEAAARICGLSSRGVMKYALPDGGERRCVVVYERTDDPQMSLPRRPGLAQRHPLSG